MERYNKGYMGQFSGKLGPASGNSWRGVSYLRSNPGKSKKKNVSEKIEIQSAKFRLAANFIKTMGSVLAITFPDYKTNMTSRNNAVANVLNQAITGDYPDLRIEYSKVFMASGSLSVTIDPPHILQNRERSRSVGQIALTTAMQNPMTNRS